MLGAKADHSADIGNISEIYVPQLQVGYTSGGQSLSRHSPRCADLSSFSLLLGSQLVRGQQLRGDMGECCALIKDLAVADHHGQVFERNGPIADP